MFTLPALTCRPGIATPQIGGSIFVMLDVKKSYVLSLLFLIGAAGDNPTVVITEVTLWIKIFLTTSFQSDESESLPANHS
jgi:hypothetical protein